MAVWHKSGSVSHQWYGFCVYGNQNLMYILSTINVLRLSCRTQVITKNACIWTFYHQVFWEQMTIRYGFYSCYIFMLRKLFGKRQGQSAISSFCWGDLIQFLFALICISGRSHESFTFERFFGKNNLSKLFLSAPYCNIRPAQVTNQNSHFRRGQIKTYFLHNRKLNINQLPGLP